MARTQTFLNNEIGFSIRTKLNSLSDWNIVYSYNANDITHFSGSIYTSLVDSNIGNSPINLVFWKNLSTSASYAATASYANQASD